MRKICVLGGTGFVGSHIVHRLSTEGYTVTVLTRRRELHRHLILLPNVQVVECNIRDSAALKEALTGVDAVINLVGILHEGHGATFSEAHDELPRRLVTLCQSLGVPRLLHMSALHAAQDAPSTYLRSKADGEQDVIAAHSKTLKVTVFRPSVIFGRGDSFLGLFACLVKWLPVIALACPQARFQPVWVGDVAQAFVTALNNPATFGQSYDLCGPKVYTLRELVQFVADTLRVKRCIIGLNDRLSYLQVAAMELLPFKLITRDNYYSMQVDSVCDCDFPPVFGIRPTPLEAVAPGYLSGDTPRAAYLQFREKAGR